MRLEDGGSPTFSRDHPTAVQLRLIGELTAGLQAAGIPHWLFGGWVIDFAAGEITRPHSDIDLTIWSHSASTFQDLLTRQGYTELPSPSGPELDAQFCNQGQLVDVMLLQVRPDGEVYWDDWRWPADALQAGYGRLGDIICPIVSPRFLLDCKEAFLRQENGPDEPEKHTRDVTKLRLLLGLST